MFGRAWPTPVCTYYFLGSNPGERGDFFPELMLIDYGYLVKPMAPFFAAGKGYSDIL